MQELLKILEDARPDVDFNEETKLIDGGVLDSFDLALIISDLNDEFDIHIRVTHLNPENFNSAEAMFKLVQELKEN